MKKAIPLFFVILLFAEILKAQSSHNTFVPFPVWFVQNAADFQIQRNGERSIVYKNIASREDMWLSNAWVYYDSANYNYSSDGYLMDDSTLLYNSGAWTNTGKVVYHRTAAGLPDTTWHQVWDFVNNDYTNNTRNVEQYNSNNRVLSNTTQAWMAQQNSWLSTTGLVYTWDANNNETSILNRHWDTTSGAWINSAYYLFTFDNNNNETRYEILQWNTGTSSWDSIYLYNYTYDANKNLLTFTQQSWIAGAWQYTGEEIYTYDANNNKTSDTGKVWNTAGSMWVNGSLTVSTYNSSNKDTLDIYRTWDTTGNQWINTDDFARTYNTAGFVLTEVDGTWDSLSNIFARTEESVFTYDASNNNTAVESYSWSGNAWAPEDLSDFSYDANNNFIYELDEEYNTGTQAFDNIDRFFFYYNSFNVSSVAESANSLGISVFPNPAAHGSVSLAVHNDESSSLNINIYDIQGRMVSTEVRPVNTGDNVLPLNINEMQSGNYYIQVTDRSSGNSGVLKFVKE